MKKKIISSALSLTMTSGMLMGLPGVAFADTTGIKIDATNFPDSVFRAAVAEYDFDSNGYLSDEEIGYASYINVADSKVTSLKGVEYLTNLKSLYAEKNEIDTVDLSKNTELTALWLFENNITSIDLSKNTKLYNVDLDYTGITTVDLSNLKDLVVFSARGTQLTSLDLSKNTKLENVFFTESKVSSLKLPTSAPLKVFNASFNKLSGKLDFSAFDTLEDLSLDVNELTEVVVGTQNNLYSLGLSTNKLTKIDVSKCPNIALLWLNENNFSDLDISKNTELIAFAASFNPLKKVDFGNNTNLEMIALYGCELTDIDVSMLTNLNSLSVIENNLTKLDISKNTKLTGLYVDGNALTSVDISNCPNLVQVVKNTTPKYTGVDEYYELLGSLTADVNVVEEYAPYWTYTNDDNSLIVMVSPDTDLVIDGVTKSNPSEPGVGGFITRLYDVTFGRKPDMEGKNYWKSAVTYDGKNGADLARAFLCSPEFDALKTSDEKFVEILYTAFFDRASDNDGKAYWLGQIKSGMTRDDVITGFVNSKEWADICMGYGIKSGSDVAATVTVKPNSRIVGFAKRLYTTCLGRDAEEAGLKYWAEELANYRKGGSEAAKGFFFSEELVAKNLTNEDFVNRLYLTFMDRQPDEGGMNYWLGEMKNGMTAEQVFDGFACSEEWAKICANYGINK